MPIHISHTSDTTVRHPFSRHCEWQQSGMGTAAAAAAAEVSLIVESVATKKPTTLETDEAVISESNFVITEHIFGNIYCIYLYMWLIAKLSYIHYVDVIMTAMASQISSLTIVYSTVYWGADQRKFQSSASLAFVQGIHRWPVNSPHKGPVTRKMFPFDDVIMSSGRYGSPSITSLNHAQISICSLLYAHYIELYNIIVKPKYLLIYISD